MAEGVSFKSDLVNKFQHGSVVRPKGKILEATPSEAVMWDSYLTVKK